MAGTITVAQIEAIAQLHDKMGPALRGLVPQIDKAGKAGKRTTGAFAGLDRQNALTGGSLGGLMAMARPLIPVLGIAGLAGAAGAFIGKGVAFNKTVETATTQFLSFYPNVAQAEAHVRSLTSFAATTPFQMPGILEASRTLKVFGADAVYGGDTLRVIGDAAAGVDAPLQNVSMWVGRLYTNLQAGKPIGEAAARLQELGLLSGPARAALEGLAKEGGKSEEAMALLRGEFERHDGAMARMSLTTAGLESTFGDLSAQASGVFVDAIGVSDLYKDSLTGVNSLLTKFIALAGTAPGLGEHAADVAQLDEQVVDLEATIARLKEENDDTWQQMAADLGLVKDKIAEITKLDYDKQIHELNLQLQRQYEVSNLNRGATRAYVEGLRAERDALVDARAALDAVADVTADVAEVTGDSADAIEKFRKQSEKLKHEKQRKELIKRADAMEDLWQWTLDNTEALREDNIAWAEGMREDRADEMRPVIEAMDDQHTALLRLISDDAAVVPDLEARRAKPGLLEGQGHRAVDTGPP